MMLVIHTQYQENYGAHDWDGKGVCPQYWKFKDGTEYKITGVPHGVLNRELSGVDLKRKKSGSILSRKRKPPRPKGIKQ